jgi:hypothetical protein
MPGSRLLASMLLLGALTGCGDDAEPAPAAEPSLGAQSPTASAPPGKPMDGLERPVARQLGPRLEDDGLDLAYVDCPRWAGSVPAALTCKGYVDGVVGKVKVELSRGERSRVEFDAWLDHGVVATTRLVERLEDEGYVDVDCGPTPAYPARLGMRIVCRAQHDQGVEHVVATVTDRFGHVQIASY